MATGGDFRRVCWAVGAVMAGLVLAGTIGCGGGAPYATGPVSGKITYEDGSLIDGNVGAIELIFYSQAKPLDEKIKPRPGRADVNVADGTFDRVSTWTYGDGAILGTHKVCVFSYDKQRNWTKAVPDVYYKPDTTPLTIEISKGMKPLELTIKKPLDAKIKRK